jgi:class 3 adenylate cyclase
MADGVVIAIDIKGFARESKGKDSDELAAYLSAFYSLVAERSSTNDWAFVKTMGDCVLLTAPTGTSHEDIERFHNQVAEQYPVKTTSRVCAYTVRDICVGNYKCNDIFGHDINKLFMADAETQNYG